MSRCYFTPEARSNLQHIHDYIAQDSPANALSFVNLLEGQCERLAEGPFIGIERPEFGLDIRSFVVPGTRYMIFYRPTIGGVEVLYIAHGSRDLRRLFE